MVYISMDRVKIKTVGDEELHRGLMSTIGSGGDLTVGGLFEEL